MRVPIVVAIVVATVVLAACGSGGGFPDAAHTDGPGVGEFSIAWSLTDNNAQPITCEQAGAISVLTNITNQINAQLFSSTFACSLGSAVSGGLSASTYDLRFTLLGANGSLATVPPQTVAVVADHTVQLDAVVFTVSP